MKKLLILGLAAAMTLSLAACGGDSKTPASSNNPSTSSASGSQAGGDSSSLPEIEAGSCATPAVLTSVGQSADVEIVGTLCGKAGIEDSPNNGCRHIPPADKSNRFFLHIVTSWNGANHQPLF